MADGLFSFRARVSEDGYEWVQPEFILTGEDKGGDEGEDEEEVCSRAFVSLGWVLVGRAVTGGRPAFRTYDPLRECTGLFRTFVAIPPEDREAILRFANEYGFLGDGDTLVDGDTSVGARRYCERLTHWRIRIGNLGLAVRLWDLLAAGDEGGVKSLLGWHDGAPRAWRYASSDPFVPEFREYAMCAFSPVWPEDPWRSANFLLSRLVNNHLRDGTFAQLIPQTSDRGWIVQTTPTTLYKALWLQLARAIEGDREYRTCKECGKWFELSHRQADHRTVRRLFCSDPCKSRDYRRRKERAQQLKEEGKAVKEIAQELDTDVNTIKKWVGKRKG
jgi:hypothetical protein